MKKSRNQMTMELMLDSEFDIIHRNKLKFASYSILCDIYRIWNRPLRPIDVHVKKLVIQDILREVRIIRS